MGFALNQAAVASTVVGDPSNFCWNFATASTSSEYLGQRCINTLLQSYLMSVVSPASASAAGVAPLELPIEACSSLGDSDNCTVQ